MDHLVPVVTQEIEGRPVRTSSWWRPVVVVAVNLLLSVPGVVPMFLASYFLRNGPLRAMGLAVGNPTENDGVGVVALLTLPLVGVAVVVWFAIGYALRRCVKATGRAWFWPVSIAAVLAPAAIATLASLVG